MQVASTLDSYNLKMAVDMIGVDKDAAGFKIINPLLACDVIRPQQQKLMSLDNEDFFDFLMLTRTKPAQELRRGLKKLLDLIFMRISTATGLEMKRQLELAQQQVQAAQEAEKKALAKKQETLKITLQNNYRDHSVILLCSIPAEPNKLIIANYRSLLFKSRVTPTQIDRRIQTTKKSLLRGIRKDFPGARSLLYVSHCNWALQAREFLATDCGMTRIIRPGVSGKNKWVFITAKGLDDSTLIETVRSKFKTGVADDYTDLCRYDLHGQTCVGEVEDDLNATHPPGEQVELVDSSNKARKKRKSKAELMMEASSADPKQARLERYFSSSL